MYAGRGAAEMEFFGDSDKVADVAKFHDAEEVSQSDRQCLGRMKNATPQFGWSRLHMKSPSTRPSARPAVSTIALAAMLTPLNTSMIPVALPELQRAFDTSASASTWLLTVFALASAGHPLAGYLADRLGSRRVLVIGLVVAGMGGLAAACAATFPMLVALRAIQAIGTSAAFPAGIALLRMLDTGEGSGRPLPAAWLGAVAMSNNLGAALGPMLGGAFVATIGWQAIFLANLPIATAAAILVLRQFPADHADPQRNRGTPIRDRFPPLRGPLLSVYSRFAAACTVFFAGFFALPLWLMRSYGLDAAQTGAIMLPMVIASALTTPIAVRTVSLSGVGSTLILSASGFCVGTGLLATVDAQTSLVAPLAVMVTLGASLALSNLGLQVELRDLASPSQLATASGFFQAARFVGAGLGAGLVGITIADDLLELAVTAGIASLALLVQAASRSQPRR